MKKILPLILTLVMLCMIIPIMAFAAEESESVETVAAEHIVSTDRLYRSISVNKGQLDSSFDGRIIDSDTYGCVVNYSLKKGHVLSISDTNYVFSVRQWKNGNYSTMLKQATTAKYTATEDMTVAMLIRKPDKSPVTAEELADVTIFDSQFGMIGVEGSVIRFNVEAETIDGGTATTRAAIFLPKSYSETGKPTHLIVMTNGYSAHLTDSVWNKNSEENVRVIQNYLNADYAVWVVDNTAAATSQTPDLGCPQLVDSYLKAYEYIQNHLNVEKKFSVHARSFGTFAAVRMMRECPELIKCAVMTGSRVSIKAEWPGIKKAHVANRFGFADTTGATYEADKLVGYDPYTDVKDTSYTLPPTFWMLANGDSTAKPCEFIETLTSHGNDVTLKIYSDISHTGICTLNTVETFSDALAYLEKYQIEVHLHTYTPTVTAPTCTKQGYTTYTCACGESYVDDYVDATGKHSYENGTCTACGKDIYPDILDGHLQMLPEEVYAHTNLWPLLVPENVYFYAGTHWGSLDDVVSVTIPVTSGDQIYASSFKRGIRVAFFDADGLLVSMSNSDVKKEFEQKGYITVPEGAIAANIPMWDNSVENVLKNLSLERFDCEEHVFSVTDMITEPGLVSKGSAIRICENCGYTEKTEIPELMQAGVFTYQDNGESVAMPYRIYYPSSYDRGDQKQWPLVIFYHGAGSRGSDNQAQVLGKAILNRLVELDHCIIVAPQCNTGYQWVNTPWGDGSYNSASVQKSIYLDASVALLDDTVLAENIDEDRVYAIGLSMGGYATWNVMMEYPEKFAAVVPICGAADPGRAKDVLGVAVWAFHGDEDSTVPVSGSREMIEAIRTLGGVDVQYTEYAGVGHSSWVNAFDEPELTDWLFSKRRHTHTYQNGICTSCGAVEEIPEPAYEYGDVDQNGAVDTNDAVCILRYAAMLETLEGERLRLADANGDGEVDERDAVVVLRHAAHFDELLGGRARVTFIGADGVSVIAVRRVPAGEALTDIPDADGHVWQLEDGSLPDFSAVTRNMKVYAR